MRRVVWSVLTGLGVFFIVLAILSKFLIPGMALKFPLNEYSKTTLQAVNASYFSPKFVTEESGVTLQVTSTTKGDVAAAKSIDSSRVAVWQSYSATWDLTNHTPVDIPAQGNTLAFDRKTGVLVPWSGNTVAGSHVDVTGNEQGSLFPLGTKKQDYQVFDTTLKKPVTFHFTGTATTNGISTYVFKATLPATQTGTQSLPGSLVGPAEMPGHAVHVRQKEQQFRAEFLCEQRRHAVLVDDRFDARESPFAAGHRNSAPAGRHHRHARVETGANRLEFHNLHRLRRGHPPPPAASGVFSHLPAERPLALARLCLAEERTNGLGGQSERRIAGVHHHLRDHGHDDAGELPRIQSVLDRLHEQIADAALCFGYAGVERFGGEFGLSPLGAQQQMAHLRPVPVRHHHPMARSEHGRHGLARQPRVPPLLRKSPALALWHERIAAYRHHRDRFHLRTSAPRRSRPPSTASRIALCAGSRLPA